MVRRQKKTKLRPELLIPSSIFVDSTLSPLEAIVSYLKDKRNLSFSEISDILDRDERNIWTVYNRAGKKLQKVDINK